MDEGAVGPRGEDEMRVSTTLIGACAALLVLSVAGIASAEAAEGTPTFAKDIAPILYENCVACHRPNHLAPMSLSQAHS